jgi:putative tryptophan/tyrosine transport system substrate-binding protein
MTMRRRDFITLLGGAAAWPLAARAQQVGMPVVGFLGIEASPEQESGSLASVRDGLRETGFVEGRNVILDIRLVADDFERLRAAASDLVHRPVAALVAAGSAKVARAAQAATSTVPIVFGNGSDPVKVGLVASMNRPGGNATGATWFTSSLVPKRLELLRELLPQVRGIAFLMNPTNPVSGGDTQEIQEAALTLGLRIIVVKASTLEEIKAAFATVPRERIDAMLVDVDAFFSSQADQFADLAVRYRIPVSYNYAGFVTAGGLMSYGDDRQVSRRWMGIYAGRILKGEKPADLPVIQPTKFELAINLKAAKAIGLAVPELLLARADIVIE